MFSRRTILLVEDDQSYRRLLHEYLEAQGYTVLSAWSGKDALSLCEQHRGAIDLLLADVVLPGMSGTELARRLLRLYPGLKVLFMSGYPDDARVQRLQQAPEQAILAKPFLPQALLQRVRETLINSADHPAELA